jgi:hypothetical protein
VAAVDSLGEAPAGVVTNIAGQAATMLQGLNALFTPGGRLVIWSKAAQTVTDITAIRVGHVVDTQRRRRRSLSESYTAPIAL